ncbi:MAG TPA: POTRA domain-containing protein, partial [Bryobacteraceae bacterium]
MAMRNALHRCCSYPLALLILPFCIAAADLEPPSAYEGKTIQAVRFEPESQPILRADLDRIFPFKPGMALHLADVREAIKAMYATGLYSDIAMDAEPASGGVTLVIRTTEQWFVGPVEVRGKTKYPPNEGQLANATRLELGAAYDEEVDFQNAVKGLRDMLQRNGLYRAKVEPKQSRDAEHQEIAITFQVNAGKR